MRTKKARFITSMVTYGVVIALFIILTVMIDNKSISRTLKGQLIPICSWIVMAVSLNLVVGISGELSLGHAGFMSLGAFSGIVMSGWLLNGFQMEDPSLRLILAILAGGLVAGVVGALIGIPVLRLRGDYLAIVTLAFGEIIKNVMNCVYVAVEGKQLHWGFLTNELPGTLLLNGPMGAVKVKAISTFTAGFLLVMFTLIVVLNLANSRSGRAIMAARDNRIAAESMGIHITKYKMMAFVTAAVLAGMAGALYGLSMATLVPTKFSFNESINVLVFVVLGGIGNIPGSIVSAAALTILPEKLRFLQNYRMLAYAVLLILAMLLSNNPVMKSLLKKLIPWRKKPADGEEAMRA
ncbi:MAG: branched-chain amino acid ABC transporter permease [Clostridia bacterium]|nr:branched-chain amino acid ABC transporter permease [Clostridia bacterium]